MEIKGLKGQREEPRAERGVCMCLEKGGGDWCMRMREILGDALPVPPPASTSPDRVKNENFKYKKSSYIKTYDRIAEGDIKMYKNVNYLKHETLKLNLQHSSPSPSINLQHINVRSNSDENLETDR